MAHKLFTLHILTLFFISSPCFSSVELNYPAVFNFGDSNSDTGGLVAGMGFRIHPPYGQTYFKKPSGRFTDGRVIIDFLMDAMDMPFLNPYLDSIGAPSFRRGCNFAASGSTILPATASSICPYSFGRQVKQFLRFKARVLDILAEIAYKQASKWLKILALAEELGEDTRVNSSTDHKQNCMIEFKICNQTSSTSTNSDYLCLYYGTARRLDKYLPASHFFVKGLYIFDIGQNDLDNAFYSESYDQVIDVIPTILEEFEAGIKRLYDNGARNFWVHNTGPLGCLPRNIAQFGKDISKLDNFGCVDLHNQASRLFNLQLHALCTELQGQYTDANVTYVDIFTIKSTLIGDYSRYGFEQPIMACCGYGGPPLNYDGRLICGGTNVLNGSSVTAKVCNDSSKYVSWDGVHYTEAANHFIATEILTGKYWVPPFLDKMPLFLKLKL